MIQRNHPNSYIFRYKVKKQKGKNYLEKRLAVPKKGCLNIKFLIIERWVQIAMWSISRNVLHATERVRSSHQFALIITVWKLITITQFTSERSNKIHDFHDCAILEVLYPISGSANQWFLKKKFSYFCKIFRRKKL